jgi:hypothetical protein
MYVYALLRSSTVPTSLPDGITSALQIVGDEQLAAVVEPNLSLETLQQDDQRLVQAVLRHDHVIQMLFSQTTVLPLRFGTCFFSQESLVAHLNTQQQQYLEKLVWLEGKAEYTLKCIPHVLPDLPIPAAAKGKDYFLAKKQQYQAQLEWQSNQKEEMKELIGAIAKIYPAYLLENSTSDLEKIHFLGDLNNATMLDQALERWHANCPHWDLELSEALPPYHFVSQEFVG